MLLAEVDGFGLDSSFFFHFFFIYSMVPSQSLCEPVMMYEPGYKTRRSPLFLVISFERKETERTFRTEWVGWDVL